MSFHRDAIVIISLTVILLLCFPLLGSLLGGLYSASLAQTSATGLPGEMLTPTPLPRVYLLPFRQVFAIGQSQPNTRSAFLLYENGTDVFRLINQQGAFAHVETLDGKMGFWTMAENITTSPPLSAQYDFDGRGKTIRLVPQTAYACLHEDAPPPSFSTCQSLPNFGTAKLVAKITSGAVTMYLVEIDGKNYFLPPEAVLTIP